MGKAVFLDRDGTINEDAGYICSMEQFQILPGAIEALKMLQADHALFIVTNQSGVGRNFFSEQQLISFNQEVERLLLGHGVHIQKTYYCPHLKEDGCGCHKPSPFFLHRAAKDYDIDLSRSAVIGDHPHDIELAHNVGARSVYVLTGHGSKHRDELAVEPDFIAGDLHEGALWIAGKKAA